MHTSRVSFALLFAALLALLAGCGGQTSEAPEQTAQAPSQAAQAPSQAAQAPSQATQAPSQTGQAQVQSDQTVEQGTAPEQQSEAPEKSAVAPQQSTEAAPEATKPEEAPEKTSEPETSVSEQKPPVEKAVASEEPAAEPDKSAEQAPTRKPDIFFLPTPQAVVERMLELAEIKKGDVVYDLGCGDGRIVVTAAKKYGVKAYGFDIDPERVKDSRENAKRNNVEDLVTIKQADIFELDLSDADVVTLYLLPRLNVKLMPQLEKLKPGSRIVSHDFDMRGAKPQQVVTMTAASDNGNESEHTIYVWTVPWEKE